MWNDKYELVGENYTDTSEVPKDHDLFYRCLSCCTIIPSIPRDNIGCQCGKVDIDRDMWQLWVEDFGQFQVLRKK